MSALAALTPQPEAGHTEDLDHSPQPPCKNPCIPRGVHTREGESLEPKKCGRPAGGGKLGPHEDFLIELVEQDPDITLAELRGALIEAEDVTVGVPAIFRMLKRLGFTYKKDAGRG